MEHDFKPGNILEVIKPDAQQFSFYFSQGTQVIVESIIGNTIVEVLDLITGDFLISHFYDFKFVHEGSLTLLEFIKVRKPKLE